MRPSVVGEARMLRIRLSHRKRGASRPLLQPDREIVGKGNRVVACRWGRAWSDALDYFDAVGEARAINLDRVVGEGPRHSSLFNFDQVEEFVAW